MKMNEPKRLKIEDENERYIEEFLREMRGTFAIHFEKEWFRVEIGDDGHKRIKVNHELYMKQMWWIEKKIEYQKAQRSQFQQELEDKKLIFDPNF
jgi:hypothetical protein